MSATGSRRRQDNTARGATGARDPLDPAASTASSARGRREAREGPEIPSRHLRDTTPAPPSSAGTSRRGQAPPVPPRTRNVNGSKANDPKTMAASAARAAMRNAEERDEDLESKNSARDGGQPRYRMKETLRGDRNGTGTKERDGRGHGPSPLGDDKGDSHKDKDKDKDTRGGGVKGKLKNLFGGGKQDYEEDEELSAEDDVPPSKHKGSAAPRDDRRGVPDPRDTGKRRSGGTRPHEDRAGRGRERGAPQDEYTRSDRVPPRDRERERGPVPGSERSPRERERDREAATAAATAAASGRERQQRRGAGLYPEADAYKADGQHSVPYTAEAFFDPEELSTGSTCRTCGQRKPVCMACFVPYEKDRVLTRMLDHDVNLEEAKRMRQGCPCGRCGRPIHICEECGLPLRKEQVVERLQAEAKGRAKARR